MRDILVHAHNFGQRGESLRYAAQLTHTLKASLTGVYVSEPLVPLPLFGVAPSFPEYVATVAETLEEAKLAEAPFRAWAHEHGVGYARWFVAEGYLRHALANAANWHDLLILESQAKAEWSSVSVLGEILVTCGVPCLVVPELYARPAQLDNIVIAWDGRVESVRAIHSALPLLRRAKSVFVLDGSRVVRDENLSAKPVLSLDGELERHGIAFSRRIIEVDGDRAGEVILASASEFHANLLVMGGYGHARYSEWMFGGATRHVLFHAHLPVFMRH